MRWQARPRRREPSRARFRIEELEGRTLLSLTAQSFTVAALEDATRGIDLAPYVQDSIPSPVLTFSVDSPTTAAGGAVSVRDPAGGTVAYTPPGSSSAFQDSFTYSVEDQDGSTAQGQVTLDVASVAANPFIQGELEGQATIAATIARLPGAVQDVAGSPTYQFSNLQIANQAGGSVSLDDPATGALTYTPPSTTFTGPVVLSYEVTDTATGDTSSSKLTLVVAPIVAGPIVWGDLEGQRTMVPSLAGAIQDTSSKPTYSFSNFTLAAGDGTISGVNAATGSFIYDPPAAPFTGPVHVFYQVSDGTNTAPGGVTIAVSPIVAGPVAWSDLEGHPTVVPPLSATMQDVDSQATYTFSNFTAGAGGGTISGVDPTSGSFTYTPPDPTFAGTVHVYYTATDNHQDSVSGSVVITVGPLVADPITIGALEGQPSVDVPSVVGSILATDSDPTYSFSNFTVDAGDGSITNSSPTTGSFTYSPPSSSFTGIVNVHYQVMDTTDDATAPGDVIIVVAPIVTNPVSWGDLEGHPTAVPPLTSSMEDVDNQATYTFSNLTVASGDGTIGAFNPADGSFTFTPPSSGFTGTVHVYYTGTDNNDNSTNGDMVINVGPLVTDPVVLYDLENRPQAAGSLVGSVLTTDGHPTYTFSNFTIAAGDGTIGTPDPTTGAFTYTPPAGSGFTGKVDIHYKVTDTADNVSAPGDVVIVVSPIAADPIAVAAVQVEPTRVPSLVDHVQDIASNPSYTFSGFEIAPGDGTIGSVDPATGSFTYTPPSSTFTGSVKVFYTVTDTGSGKSAPGFVTINVLPTIRANGDGPLAAQAGVPLAIPASQLLANDVSPDGLPPTIESVQGAVNGTVVLNPDGSITFVPSGQGPASFTYTATDSAHDPSTTATVTLNVAAAPAPQPQPTPIPAVVSQQLITTGRGKKRKVTGAEIVFSGPLDFGIAQNVGNYRVTQQINKKKTKTVPVLTASYNPGNHSVTLLLGKSKAGKAMQLTIAGLVDGDGRPLATSIIAL